MNENSSPLRNVTLRSGRVVDREAIRIPKRRQRKAPRVLELEVEAEVGIPIPIPLLNMEDDQAPPPPPLIDEVVNPPERRMREYTLPHVVEHPSCIVLNPNLRFEIKPTTLSIMPIFHGLPGQSPYDHLMEFEQSCSTVQPQGLPANELRLRIFPFTLKDTARKWLHKLAPRSITTWVQLQETFLAKYFPPSRAAKVRNDLVSFHQHPGESFYESWERFKDLEMSCPHHGLEKWFLVDLFYRGLSPEQRQRVDTFSGGTIASKSPNEAWQTCEDLSENSLQWDDIGAKKEGSYYTRENIARGGVHDVGGSIPTHVAHEMKKLESKIETMLESKFDQLLKQGDSRPTTTQIKMASSSCLLCRSTDHEIQECHLAPQYPDFVEEHLCQVEQQSYPPRNSTNFQGRSQGFQVRSQGPYPYPRGTSSYNNNYGGAPNSQRFQGNSQGYSGAANNSQSYQGNSQGYSGFPSTTQASSSTYQRSNTYIAPPGFNAPQPQAQEPKKTSMEDLLAQLTQSQIKTDQQVSLLSQGQQELRQGQQNLQQGLAKLELQMGQLSRGMNERPLGALPSQPEQNPGHKKPEHANAISIIHSGTPTQITVLEMDVEELDEYLQRAAERKEVVLFINENFGNVSKGESGLSNSSEDEQAKVITTLRSGKLYNNKVFYDPQTRMQVPFSSPLSWNLV